MVSVQHHRWQPAASSSRHRSQFSSSDHPASQKSKSFIQTELSSSITDLLRVAITSFIVAILGTWYPSLLNFVLHFIVSTDETVSNTSTNDIFTETN